MNNKDTSIYYDIVKTVRTSIEQMVFLNAIDQLLKELYQNSPITPEIIEKLFNQKSAEVVLKSLSTLEIALSDINGIRKFFTDLSEYLKKAEVIHAKLAVMEDEGVREILGEWMEKTFPQQPVIVELSQDVSIVAGIQLDYKGRYWDYSLQQQVVKIFREKKTDLFSAQKV